MSIYSSIYIPRIASYHNEEKIRNVMEFLHIGQVEYIDFTPINKKPGFNENVDQDFKSVFIHFKVYDYCRYKEYHLKDKILLLIKLFELKK